MNSAMSETTCEVRRCYPRIDAEIREARNSAKAWAFRAQSHFQRARLVLDDFHEGWGPKTAGEAEASAAEWVEMAFHALRWVESSRRDMKRLIRFRRTGILEAS